MRFIFIFIFGIFLFPFALGLAPDFDCPETVALDEEFECTISVPDFESVLDLKIDLKDGTKSIARIYDPEKSDWKSAFYYLKEFISDSGERTFGLKIEKAGSFDGVLKLRGSSTENFEFEITVESSGDSGGEEEAAGADEDSSEAPGGENGAVPSLVQQEEAAGDEMIVLNGKATVPLEKELLYQSKSSKSLDYAPYVFSFFLIVILAIVLFQKF
jgi:hypothetical protein